MRTPVPIPIPKTGALLYALDQFYRQRGMSRQLRESRLRGPLFWKPDGPAPTSAFRESDRPALEAMVRFEATYSGRSRRRHSRSPLEAFNLRYRSEGGRLMREDEQGALGNDEYNDLVRRVRDGVGGDEPGPRLRVKCPGCGDTFQMQLPDGVAVAPTDSDDNDDEEAAADNAVTVACPACEREFGVAAPKGYRFRDAEGAAGDIACHDETGDPTAYGMGRQKAAEALTRQFLDRFLGRPPSADDSRTALEAFRESYKDSARNGRLPAMPPA